MATSSDPSPLQSADIGIVGSHTWLRITAARFKDPLGWGPGESRFVPLSAGWGGVYLGQDVVTCFREAILRDRGLSSSRTCLLEPADLDDNTCTEVSVPSDLRVVDLINGSLGAFLDTDDRSGRHSKTPAAWAGKWRTDALQPDGILYPSRFTGRPCLFVYDTALVRLKPRWRRLLRNLPDPHAGNFLNYVALLYQRSPLPPPAVVPVVSASSMP